MTYSPLALSSTEMTFLQNETGLSKLEALGIVSIFDTILAERHREAEAEARYIREDNLGYHV